MIEVHYGHINPVKHAERILMGLPGWSPVSAEGNGSAKSGGVHAEAEGPTPAKKGASKKRAANATRH